MRGIVCALLVVALTPLLAAESEAVLWDLIVNADVVGDIEYGDDIIIAGRVTNHAGWAEQSNVQIIIGEHSIIKETGDNGTFTVGIKDADLLPGTHGVYIRATSEEDRVGVLNMRITVEGEVRVSDHLARMLATNHAMRYLAADVSDFDENSIDSQLYKYYHELQERMIIQREIESQIKDSRTEIENLITESKEIQEKEIEEELKENKIELTREHIKFLEGLDEREREIFQAQVNHTLEVHRSLIATGDGKSVAERNSKFAIPRHVMEGFTPNAEFDIEEYKKELGIPNEPRQDAPETQTPEPETDIDVTTVYLNVDGVMTKHIYNGTSLVRVD